MEEGLKELELSARILLESPNHVTSEQRHLAERVFLNFRDAKHPIVTLLRILDHSKVEYVIYQASCALKDALVRDWVTLAKPEVTSLQNYLLTYVTTNKTLPPYVKEQIFQVLGVIVKRAGIDGEAAYKENVLNAVEVLIKSNDVVMQNTGCSILKVILNEYTNSGKSSEVGLTWEAHFQAKKAFEASDMKRIFRFLVMVLNEFERCTVTSQESLHLLERFLSVTEDILSWNFISINLPKRIIEMAENDTSPPLRPGALWRDIFLDENLIDLFFRLHWKVRDNENVVHHSINCLSQLASMHGTVFPNKEARFRYLVNFLQGLIKLMDNSVNNVLDHEALGIAAITYKLVSSFPPAVMNNISQQLVEMFLKILTNLTCSYAYKATTEQMGNEDERYFSEALELLLQVWVQLFDVESFYRPQCESAAAMIFEAYLQFHLSPPKGKRPQSTATDADEIKDVEENDRIKYDGELTMIGKAARCCLGHTVPLLIVILEEKVNTLSRFLKNIQEASNINQLYDLYEDLHWLLLITGHVLAVLPDGEKPVIPPTVMQYSLKVQTPSTVEASLQTLNVTRRLLEQTAAANDSDPVVRLIAEVFRLAELQKQALDVKLTSVLSPEVTSTVMWFLRRWALTYLLPDETLYTEISPSLNVTFGLDSATALWCLNFVMEQVNSTLTAWVGESEVVLETTSLLVAMVEGKDRARKVAKSIGFWEIIRKQIRNDFTLPHPKAKRCLLKALVKAGTADPDMKAMERYYVEVLKPIENTFKSVILQENFCRNFHDESTKKQIMHSIDCFIGIIQGCDLHNSHYLFTFLLPLMNELIPLLNLYHNYQDVVVPVLECFCELTKCLLCFLSCQQSRVFYESCLQMIQMYAKANIGKRNFEASAEEEQYEDLLLLMDILVNLLSKDYLDIDDGGTGGGVAAADVILFALNIIMPLMNEELLRYPQLCLCYYKMITNVCEMHPEKICQLPEGLFKNILASLHLGLTNYGTEVMQLCFASIAVIGSHVVKVQLKDPIYYEGLKPFLQLVFEMLLVQGSTASYLAAGSSALFTLICCYQDQYQEIVENLLRKQVDKQNQDRLYLAFQHLMNGVQFVDQRPNRLKFRDHFEKFLVEVRSFLFIK